MKKFILILIATLLLIGASFAQQPYTTPNTGVKYSFNDLVTASGGTVVMEGSIFVMKNDVTISALDSLEVTQDITVKIYNGKILTINGSYWKMAPPTEATFANYATGEYYATILVQSGSFVRLNKTTFTYGSGIRAIDSDFEMDNCTMNNHNFSSQASGAIAATTGKIIVKNSTFKNNVRSAFNSGANTGCTFEITNCYLEHNVTENTNRPQINIGPARAGEVSKIIDNTIIGNRNYTMVGGISTSSLLGVTTTYFIEGNTLKDNRYGITFTGTNITGTIKGNVLENNNTEVNPNNGGSGINLTASAGNVHAVITENIISGHLWGITLVGNVPTLTAGPTANIGNISVPENDPEYNIGRNIFSNNGNGGELYDLYNNNPHNVMAQNNNWGVPEQTEELIRTVIRDKFNNPSYGTVTFMPPYIIPEPCNPIKNLVVLYSTDCSSTTLTWDAPAEGDFTYNIYRDDDQIHTINETSYLDNTFDPCEGHTWAVTVVCDDGESEPVEKSLPACIEGCEHDPVTNFTVEFTEDCSAALLSWSAPADVILYNIYRNGSLIKEKHDATTYTDVSFGEGTHTWSVTALYGEEESEPATKTATCSVGIAENELAAITVLPNPTTGELRIENGELRINNVEIFDIYGRKQNGNSPPFMEGWQPQADGVVINISHLQSGFYFVEITTEAGVVVRKVVKQ